MNYQEIIDKYYPAGSPLRDIYMHHCRQVADLALEIAHNKQLQLEDSVIEEAAMLHDIGIAFTDAAGIHCYGTEPYIKHGILGAELLEREGASAEAANVARKHTGTGITLDEICQLGLPLPPGDYMPHTLLERLVCYADKFYSKNGDMQRKSLERVRASMARHGGETLSRFEELHREFGD